MNNLLDHEEQFWKQRSKSFWLRDKDSNSSFFHVATSARKKHNIVAHLNDLEVGLENHDTICGIASKSWHY